ncbi:E3 ubiquitin-protein ligase AIRP1-like [Raphanus sativus]|uniref:RING-type E3 ubiquitin transferase n=1 Tax=Raphanus sativus TaxID=3726 RepID=A0A9W3D2R7_RAPSA|nr:E3 ubiquitin-protein ligase AIRP1-like [Raphanus sativus]
MGVLLCCLRVPEQDGESRNVLRTSAFSYPISNNFPLKYEQLSLNLERREDEEDDVCPTCFHEYTEDNPKIVLQCGHIFHLACIYEWMERSQACPFCSKTMLFLESEITEHLE